MRCVSSFLETWRNTRACTATAQSDLGHMIVSYAMSKLLSVSLPDELSRGTDDLAAAQGRTRSEVVRDALRSYLWRERWRAATRLDRA